MGEKWIGKREVLYIKCELFSLSVLWDFLFFIRLESFNLRRISLRAFPKFSAQELAICDHLYIPMVKLRSHSYTIILCSEILSALC